MCLRHIGQFRELPPIKINAAFQSDKLVSNEQKLAALAMAAAQHETTSKPNILSNDEVLFETIGNENETRLSHVEHNETLRFASARKADARLHDLEPQSVECLEWIGNQIAHTLRHKSHRLNPH